MEKMIKDIRKLVPFKDTTAPGDIVLIAFKKQNQVVHAVVQDIIRDNTKRDEWWHVSLQFLTVPSRQAVWTLRTPQFTGVEFFGMGDEELFIKAVDCGEPHQPEDKKPREQPTDAPAPVSNVINLFELKKRKNE